MKLQSWIRLYISNCNYEIVWEIVIQSVLRIILNQNEFELQNFIGTKDEWIFDFILKKGWMYLCLWLTEILARESFVTGQSLKYLPKKKYIFFIAKKNTDEWKPEWYIARLFQLKFQMDEDFTCQILYTVIAIHIFHSDHLSVSALLTLFKTKPKCVLIPFWYSRVLFFERDSKFVMAYS